MKKRLLAAALAAVAAPALANAPAAIVDAEPAMWVVKDADTTVYLFGTMHALDGKSAWFNDEVKSAYDASQEVVLEMLMPDKAAAQSRVMELAIDRSGKPLTSKLKPEQAKLLSAELVKAGAPANAFDMFEPWFASTALASLRFQAMGLTGEHGPEAVLTAAAKKDGKKLAEVETFEWQMNLFDTLPEELQLAMLDSALEQMADADAMIAKMQSTWAAGDIDGLGEVINDGVRKTPQLAKLLLADRNARWADWIERRMESPGTVFIAVGAGHLTGPDSVQAHLTRNRLKAVRVQ